MAIPDPYRLPEAYLRQRFVDRVEPYLFGRHRPSPTPVLILVGGQPAAGKSLTIARLTRQHPEHDLAAVTGDDLRQFHPHMAALLAADPLAVPNTTAPAAAAWVRMAIDHALTHRYSLILEGTFRAPDVVATTIRRFAAAGYHTHVIVLAVRGEQSRLDSVLRHRHSTDGQPGRWTPPTAHDKYFEQLPTSVAAVESVTELDRISVLTRDGADIYTDHRGPGRRWQQPDRAHQALTTHRQLPLPRDEAQAWLRHYRALFDRLHRARDVDLRALPAYISLHGDASQIVDMAHADRSSRDHLEHDREHRLDQALLTQLQSTAQAPPDRTVGPQAGSRPRRGFPSLAGSRPTTGTQRHTPPLPSPAGTQQAAGNSR